MKITFLKIKKAKVKIWKVALKNNRKHCRDRQTIGRQLKLLCFFI